MDDLVSKSSSLATRERILVVDDDPLVLKAFEILLEQDGYIVIAVKDGFSAIQAIQQNNLAVIICDLALPGLSGIEVLQCAGHSAPNAVRIGLTGHTDLKNIVDSINLGHVAYFIMKPWENGVVRRLITTAIEKFRLIKENQRLQHVIADQHDELTKHHKILCEELDLGAKIHEKLLIGKIPLINQHFEIALKTIPSNAIDGDFFDFFSPIPSHCDFVIGDVMGKGMPAALVGVAVKSELRHFAHPFIHGKYCEHTGLWSDDLLLPKDILKHTHNILNNSLMELEHFVSLFYARFDFERKALTYVDCGSTKPLHYSLEKGSIELLKGSNTPIGSVTIASYEEKTVFWDYGDLFIFYSDGITESRSPTNELFGLDRLLKTVVSNLDSDIHSLLNEIKKNLVEFCQKESFNDDITLLIIKMIMPKEQENPEILKAKFLSDLEQTKNVRSFVSRLCHKMPGERIKFRTHMQLAINEAFCNIVKHGYKEEKGKEIHFQGALLHEGLLIEISDQGVGFNPEEVAAVDLTGTKENGYGLYIIREVADEVSYLKKREENGWNRLRIFKRYHYNEAKMEFEHNIIGDVLVVTPKGESLDGHDAREFKEKIIALITQNRSHDVIINLKQLQFIDSSGLGSFLAILKNLHTHGGELKLVHMNRPIRTIFELVSMHKIFEIFESIDDAMLSLK